MLRTFGWLAALSLPALLLVGPAVAQKDKDKDKEKDPDKPQWVTVTKVTAKVTAVYEDKRKLRIQIAVPKLDEGQLRAYQQAQLAYNNARDLNGKKTAQQQMQNAQAKLYTTENKDVEVQAIDDVVVRTLKPKADFDDKGRVKKLTKEQLKEAKGDPKQPGYKADFGDLQTEQIVQVTVVRKKGSPAPKAPKIAPKKGKEDADLAALAEDSTPQVSLIMIVMTPPSK